MGYRCSQTGEWIESPEEAEEQRLREEWAEEEARIVFETERDLAAMIEALAEIVQSLKRSSNFDELHDYVEAVMDDIEGILCDRIIPLLQERADILDITPEKLMERLMRRPHRPLLRRAA